MGNCLVTKLKGSVSNDSLKKLGSLCFGISAGPRGTVDIGIAGLSNPVTVKILGDGYFSNDSGDNLGKTKTVTFSMDGAEQQFIIMPTSDCTLEVQDVPYGIMAIFIRPNGLCLDLNDAVRYRRVYRIYKSGNSDNILNIDNIAYPEEFRDLVVNGCAGVTGNISKFSGINMPGNLIAWQTNIEGDISNFADMVSTTVLQVGYNSKITGVVEDLLVALRNKGKTGDFYFSVVNSSATFNGSPMTNDCIVQFTDNGINVVDAYTFTSLGSYDGTSWTYPQ